MDNKKTIVHLKSAYKEFVSNDSTIKILENADLIIEKGETIAVVGASGIGKSTLLNIIGTLDQLDKGNLFFNNEDISLLKDFELARFRNINIGFVFQFHHLLFGFSALENVMIPCMIHSSIFKHHDNKEKYKNIKDSALQILNRVGLNNRVSSRVEDLSGGEQQRVALARALVNSPDLLLADEPTGNLDKKNSQGVHQLISELNEEMGMTVVIVTHNEELAGLLERQITIADGKILAA